MVRVASGKIVVEQLLHLDNKISDETKKSKFVLIQFNALIYSLYNLALLWMEIKIKTIKAVNTFTDWNLNQ